MVLSLPLKALQGNGELTGYFDNTLLLARSEKDAVSIAQAHGSALKAHPVGPFWPRIQGIFEPGRPINFLGHQLNIVAGKVRIDPSPENNLEFECKFAQRLVRLAKQKNEPRRLTIAKDLRDDVKSWTANFRLCDGMSERRISMLARIHNALGKGA
jgi:hypothetical protein